MSEGVSAPRLGYGLIPLLLFILLGFGAARIVPSDYTRDPRPTPPDEGPHIGYIEYLAEHHSLPLFRSPNDNYEAHQPPLYYVTCLPAALVLRAVTPGPIGGLSRTGLVLLRCFSVLLAALSIWFAWLLGRRLFPRSTLLALGPPLFLALLPGRTFIVAAVTNDGLAEALCLLTFLLCVRTVSEPLNWKRVAGLGVALAAAMLTKSTSLALAPIVLLALAIAAQREEGAETRQLKRLLTACVLLGAVVAILAGWWFVRNQMLYGDPLAAQAFERLFSKDRATPEYFLQRGLSWSGYYSLVTFHTLLSFWGVFGQANVYQPRLYYLVGLLILAWAVLGFIFQWLRGRLTPSAAESTAPPDRSWLLAWLTLALAVAFFLRFNLSFFQAQARYLGTAHGPLAALLTLGLWDLDRRRWGAVVLYAALGLMLLMSIWSVAAFPAIVAAHFRLPFPH